MKGRAVVFTDKLQVSYQEVEVPQPDENDVVIDVEFSWISPGTESSFFKAERINGETMRTDEDPWPFPQVAGYQKVGTVLEVGKNVKHVAAGDRVFASVSKIEGMFFPFGGHISPAVTPSQQVWKLPDSPDPIAYSGMVLTQVGYNCGTRAPVKKGDVAIVIGDGLVGQWSAQTLVHRGAQVYVLGRHDQRLQKLPEPVIKINSHHQDIEAELEQEQVSVIVDTVGSMPTIEKIWPYLKRDSHLVSAGFLHDTGLIDIQRLRMKEITLHTPSGWSKARMDATLQGIKEGWLQTKSLITHQYPVEEVDKAWELILSKKEPSLGVILQWKK